MEEYLGRCLSESELVERGYAQFGYQSILCYSKWKEQRCPVGRSELIARIEIDVDETAKISVSALQEFMAKVVSSGVDDVDVSTKLYTDWNMWQVTGTVELSATRIFESQTESDLMSEYLLYVSGVHSCNNTAWIIAGRRKNREHEDVDAERALYIRLQRKYGGSEVG